MLRARLRAPPSALPLTRSRARAGKVGPFVWAGGLLNICLAAFFEYEEYKYKPAGTTWTIGEAVLVWVMMAGLFALVGAHAVLGSKRHIVASADFSEGAAEDRRGLLQ